MAATIGHAKVTAELEQAWKRYISSANYFLAVVAQTSWSPSKGHVFEGLPVICRGGFAELAALYLRVAIEEAFRTVHIKRCWQVVGCLGSPPESADDNFFQEWEKQCVLGLEELQCIAQRYSQLLKVFCQEAWDAFHKVSRRVPTQLYGLQTGLQSFIAVSFLSAATLDFEGLLRQCYRWRLDQFPGVAHKILAQRMDTGHVEEDEDGSEVEELLVSLGLMDNPMALITEQPEFEMLSRMARCLTALDLEDVSSRAYEAVASAAAQAAVEKLTRGELTKSVLHVAEAYMTTFIVPFLSFLMPPEAEVKGGKAQNSQRLKNWEQRLRDHSLKTVGLMRVEDLFDIAKIYPDSISAVEDLEVCMERCGLQRHLIRVFRNSCATRLHIPGAKTNDILDIYVNSIKILRQVDSTGVLLEAVSGPTREYLQGRKDTIRCIVTAMTDDKSEVAGESLFDELQRPAIEDEDDEEQEDDGFALEQSEIWRPDPVHPDIRNPAKAAHMHDIISMLVQIYGSKDLFINEYRGMLAERLLSKSDYDTDNEIRTLEHLKKRFGEHNLHSCEVMMKDLADSKRLFNTIKVMPNSVRSPVRKKKSGPNRGIGPVSATILSALFWPPLQEEDLILPEKVEDYLNEFAAKYWVLKQPRKLQWKNNLGAVELTLTANGVSKDFSVLPYEATIIMHFERKATWLAEDLAKAMGTKLDILLRKAGFWVKHGVLTESLGKGGKPSYTRATTLSQLGDGAAVDDAPIAMEEEEAGGALVSLEDQLKKEMAMYEQYIMGMLTNFESGLPLDRIHNMLKMFVPEQAYDKTSEQLSGFLGQLVADEKLKIVGDIYSKRTT